MLITVICSGQIILNVSTAMELTELVPTKKALASKVLNFDFSIKALSSQTCLSRGSRIYKTCGSGQRNRFCNKRRSDSISDLLIRIKTNSEESGKSCHADVPAIFFCLANCTSGGLFLPGAGVGRKAALDTSLLNLLL